MGLSNIGALIVYRICSIHPKVEAHRLFLEEDPTQDKILLVDESGKKRDPKYFDVIAFSVSFENDLINIPLLLQSYSIPVYSAKRDENHPLLIMGGVVSFSNPEPAAEFVDLFLLGEAEAFLSPFLDYLTLAFYELSRSELLLEIQKLFGFAYVPQLYIPTYGSDGLIQGFFPKDQNLPTTLQVFKFKEIGKEDIGPPISHGTEARAVFEDMALLEIGRGCKRACRFCLAGHIYRPPRWYHTEAVLEALRTIRDQHKKVGIFAPSLTDMPDIERILAFIIESDLTCNISSTRVDAITPSLLRLLKDLNQKTFTLAIEAGSERLRRLISKHLLEEEILNRIETLASVGFNALKLYFMVGLPKETREDVEALIQLVKKIRHVVIKTMSPKGKVAKIKVVLSCFVPKPFTPLQWCGMLDIKTLKERQNMVIKALKREGGITITTDVPKWAYVQCLISQGDRRISEIILAGNKFNWDLDKIRSHTFINPDFFVRREKDLGELLPWDFIDHGIRKEYLIEEYRRAMEGKESPGCLEACNRCGVCGG